MRICPKCKKEYEDSWLVCLTCNVKLRGGDNPIPRGINIEIADFKPKQKKGFLSWFFQPVTECFDGDVWGPNEERAVDVSSFTLPQAPQMKMKPKVFRPTTFADYIGQEKAKNILKAYIKGTKEREKIMPHVLIHGKAGCGKTTLAKIIAAELGVMIKESITSGFDLSTLSDTLREVENSILFLDEIHGLPREGAEQLYSAMEDFQVDGYNIGEFTLIGATTELGEIIKDRRPFYDRFKIIIELEDYEPKDLATIAKQYKEKTFPDDVMTDEVLAKIGRNSRGTPRTAIRLTEATIYLGGDLDQVLDNYSIIKDGFTLKDLKVLEYVGQNENGVGLQGLASYLQTSTENYTYEIEPYLLQQGLILRTPRGRKITDNGLKKIKELKS